ncbi:MAG: phosphonate C-P lyase system protein PhnH [Pseudomonadota bacterium]
MDVNSLEGGFADAPRDSAFAFRAALSALSRPGKIERITGASGPAPLSPAAATLIITLCDPDAGIYLAGEHDTEEVRAWVAFHTGAPLVAREEAAFAVGHWSDLLPLNTYPIGTPEYPDRSTTLIVEVPSLEGPGTTLSGPGIKDTATLPLPDVDAFRANEMLFPLGLDFFLTAGSDVAGLPRTTKVHA